MAKRKRSTKKEEPKIPPVEVRDPNRKKLVDFCKENLRDRVDELLLENERPSPKMKQYLESLERGIYRKPFVLGYLKRMSLEHEKYYVNLWLQEYKDQKKKEEKERLNALKRAEKEAKKKSGKKK